MTVSICAYDMAAPDLLDLAVAADELGFDSLWLGEHLVLPVGYETAHPTTGASTDHHHHAGPIVSSDTELLDPWVELAAIAGATRRLRLATGIYILPLRHPLMTARAACTLQEVSGGRLVLGVGSGWLREEFEALGIPFADRGARFEESIELLRQAWSGGPFEHHGDYFQTGPIQVTPRPTHVPLILGGNTPRALRRAARVADGWFSSGTPTFDAARDLRDKIAALRADDCPQAPFRCYFRVGGCDPAVIERYRREGIDDVVIWADQLWPDGTLEEKRTALAAAAEALSVSS